MDNLIWSVSILVLLFVLIFSNITVTIKYDKTFIVQIYYLLFNYKIPLNRKGYNNLGQKKTNKYNIYDNIGSIINRTKSFSKRISDILSLSKNITSFSKKKVHCKEIRFYAQIGTSDAAETAIICGSLWAFIYSSYAIIPNFFSLDLKHPTFDVIPVYNQECLNISFYGIFYVRLVNIISISLKLLIFKIFNK